MTTIPQSLSRGARRFLYLIQKFVGKYGSWGFFASQRWIAVKLGASVRTVKRWLAELRLAGHVETRRRSQDTSLYDILAPQVAPQVAPHIKEEPSVVSLPEKKPAARETRSAEMPPYEVPNEFGRMVVNPEYSRIRSILEAADDRIRRARCPEAYARAIIAREKYA